MKGEKKKKELTRWEAEEVRGQGEEEAAAGAHNLRLRVHHRGRHRGDRGVSETRNTLRTLNFRHCFKKATSPCCRRTLKFRNRKSVFLAHWKI